MKLSIYRIVTTDEVWHVHAPGCLDTAKAFYQPQNTDGPAEVAEWASAQALVEDYYSGHLSDDPDATWEDYLSEFKFFPCVKALP